MSSPIYCPDCKGTGADQAKTADARRKGICDRHSYIRCWNCNGNGLDPAAYFRWSTPNPQPPTPNTQQAQGARHEQVPDSPA